jgi:hypothetical protein
MGSTDDQVTGSFPIVQHCTTPGGIRYCISIYYYRGELVLLYYADGILFAAMHAAGMRTQSQIKWYFVDSEIMQDYIQAWDAKAAG